MPPEAAGPTLAELTRLGEAEFRFAPARSDPRIPPERAEHVAERKFGRGDVLSVTHARCIGARPPLDRDCWVVRKRAQVEHATRCPAPAEPVSLTLVDAATARLLWAVVRRCPRKTSAS